MNIGTFVLSMILLIISISLLGSDSIFLMTLGGVIYLLAFVFLILSGYKL